MAPGWQVGSEEHRQMSFLALGSERLVSERDGVVIMSLSIVQTYVSLLTISIFSIGLETIVGGA